MPGGRKAEADPSGALALVISAVSAPGPLPTDLLRPGLPYLGRAPRQSRSVWTGSRIPSRMAQRDALEAMRSFPVPIWSASGHRPSSHRTSAMVWVRMS